MLTRRIPRTPLQHKRLRTPPQERSRSHLSYIRALPCVGCGRPGPSEAAHIRKGTDGGMALRPSDRWTTPLCRICHRRQHEVGEVVFFGALGVDAHALAERLWRVSGNIEAGGRAVLRARQRVAE